MQFTRLSKPVRSFCKANSPVVTQGTQARQESNRRDIALQLNSSFNRRENIKVSVIIPVYNKSKTIERALNSVLSSKRDDIEYIFVDDLSTDNSRDVLEKIRVKYDNVLTIFNAVNVGAGASRNIGFKNAIGEYIFFLDADDQVNGSALSELIRCADDKGADLVRGKIEGVRESGGGNCVAKQFLLHNYDVIKDNVSWQRESSLWFYWYFYSNLYRRSFLEKNYIRFPEGVRNEDPLFLCKCYLYAKNIVLHPACVYSYTIAETHQRRSGADFLKGWVYGYYAIYQIICASKIQKMHFLCHFPSFERHSRVIVDVFDKENALKLFSCISVMFRSFNDDIESYEGHLSSLIPSLNNWEKAELERNISFAKAISGSNASEIYGILKSK